jgi:signal transduction histidine kinase
VLDLARIEAGKLVLSEGDVDIDGLIRACASLMRERLARSRLRLVLNIEAGLPLLRADPVRLKQVLLNLLSNAIKFTEPGGRITIRAGRYADGGLTMEIADTGIGIDPQNIPRAFEPFNLIHDAHSRAHEGTGLGLPLSKALVEEHGGKLALTSALGSGTIATVTMPAMRFNRATADAETTLRS